jgi:hypothetical protein
MLASAAMATWQMKLAIDRVVARVRSIGSPEDE